MANLDVFKWCVQTQNGGGAMTTSNNDRAVMFGNGYRQVASSGFNTVRREYKIVYTGKDHQSVEQFLQSHRLKPFAFTPPDGKIGLFITMPNTVASNPVSKNLLEISATISEEFTKM